MATKRVSAKSWRHDPISLTLGSRRATSGTDVLIFRVKVGPRGGGGPAPEGIDPFSYAAVRNQRGVVQVLLGAGANVEAVSFEGNMGWATPVHHAAFQSDDHAAVIKDLLAHGANPNAISSAGSTAIHTAAEHDRLAAVALLEDAGAIVDVHIAVILGRVDVVKRFLAASSAWLEAEDGYRSATPIYFAAKSNRPDIVRLLAEHGARLDKPDNYGWTAALNAVSYAVSDALLALADMGADLNFRSLNDRWGLPKGNNVLHASVRQGFDVAVFERLVQGGADRTCRDSKGELPVDVARANGKDSLVEVLTV